MQKSQQSVSTNSDSAKEQTTPNTEANSATNNTKTWKAQVKLVNLLSLFHHNLGNLR